LGLKAARTEHIFCAACDIPFIHPGIISEIIGAIAPGVQAVVPRYRGFLEPLCAVYTKSCLDPIHRSLTEDSYSIQSLFDSLVIKKIEENTLLKHDPAGYTFFNINCLEDYQRAGEMYHELNSHQLPRNIRDGFTRVPSPLAGEG
jgi:molybdopterin-guanine dinucleotide biosynthesis protein A